MSAGIAPPVFAFLGMRQPTTPMHQVSGRRVRVDQFCNLGNVIDRTGDPYDWIERSPDLLRPIIAAKDVAEDEGDRRRQIAEPAFDSFAPQLDLSFAAAIYGLVGLFWARL